MSLATSFAHVESDCFPRVSGDEPQIVSSVWDGIKFSPRERG